MSDLKISIVVAAYNMARELPRTIRSLSPLMQRGVQRSDYEIIVVDNGSNQVFDEATCQRWGADLRLLKIEPAQASPSPVLALNLGIAQARADLIGVMIDGARLASPGIVASAVRAARLDERAVVLTLTFHLGSQVQMVSVRQGYNSEQEDRLLDQSGWTDDGYRLFDISVPAGLSRAGWFRPIGESNAIFMHRELWKELGGFDEKFQSQGGGLVNLDLLSRAVQLPGVVVVTLLGEGTFHQVHGGIASNAIQSMADAFNIEYEQIRGRPFQMPVYRSWYFGSTPDNALSFIRTSTQPSLHWNISSPVSFGVADLERFDSNGQLEHSRRLSSDFLAADVKKPANGTNVAVCVAGMHRSGTSMVAQLLSQCGLYLGPEHELISADYHNRSGYWENTSFIEVNHAILTQLDGGWDMPPVLMDGWDLQPELLPLRDRAATLVQRFATHSPWGWKDPRTSLTWAFWKRLIPNLKLVICLRHPLEVAQSLARRGYTSKAFGINLWLAYYQRLLADVHPEDRIITHYESFFCDANTELRRLINWLQLCPSEADVVHAIAGISSSQRHNYADSSAWMPSALPDDVLQVYAAWCAEAGPVFQRIRAAELSHPEGKKRSTRS